MALEDFVTQDHYIILFSKIAITWHQLWVFC